MEDGGYYAIKGFNFQIDKALCEIFSTKSAEDLVHIEYIQDINTTDVVYQIKHKETQAFSNSKVREPIVKLIQDYILDPQKNYCLYCYFSDSQPGKKTLTLSDLNQILTIKIKADSSKKIKDLNQQIKTFTAATLNGFISKFELIFAHNYDSQYSTLIDVFLKEKIAGSVDEAETYYCLMAEHLRRLVISNVDKATRSCSREQLKKGIIEARETIFKNIGDYHKGRDSIINLYKKEISPPDKDKEVHIFIGGSDISPQDSLKIIADVLDNRFRKALYNIRPLTFIYEEGIPSELKEMLLENNYHFNDGYENIKFNSDYYCSPHFFTRKIAGSNKVTDSLDRISFKLRLISFENYKINFNSITKPRLAYCFNGSVPAQFLTEHNILNHLFFGLNKNEIISILLR